jgi:hypothetical protein
VPVVVFPAGTLHHRALRAREKQQEETLSDRSIRRALVVGGAVLVVAALAGSALAGASGSARPGPGHPRMPAALPDGYGRTASLDPLVRHRLARRGSVEALITLAGSSTLSGARAGAGGDSRALLRRTVPAYRSLKASVHVRVSGLDVLQDYRALPVELVRIDSRRQLARLRSDPAVIGIGANRRDRAELSQSLPLIGQPAAAAAGNTGAGTAVAVLDSGVDFTRAAFGSCSGPGTPGCKVVVAQDFAPDDGMRDDPAAGFHGTNVSGIVVGVAPGTEVLGLDVFNGLISNTATQVNAINFVILQQATYNIRAINMSLGASESFNTSPCGDPADPRVAAFANARAAGILPVVAAGNSRFANGSNHVGIARPACIPGAFPVGAVYDSDTGGHAWGGPNANDVCTDATSVADQITCFSQVWTAPMMLAPGALITAAGVTQAGTSQAAPHVAGAVAVLFGAGGSPTVGAVEDALRSSGPSISDPLVGRSYHRLDLPSSIAALGVTTTSPPPTTTPGPGACTIEGTADGEVLFGTSGDDVICGNGGNDILVTGGGSDTVVGGSGFDLVSLEDASGGGTIDLSAGLATAPGISATLQQVEGGVGSPFDDTLIGDASDNDLIGQGGDDDIDGRGGFDLARHDFAIVSIRADLRQGSALGEGADTLTAVEGVVGGTKRDTLSGDARGNLLVGLKGNDRLFGLGRPDVLAGGLGADHLLGGGGNDSLAGGPGADTCNVGPGGGVVSSC